MYNIESQSIPTNLHFLCNSTDEDGQILREIYTQLWLNKEFVRIKLAITLANSQGYFVVFILFKIKKNATS